MDFIYSYTEIFLCFIPFLAVRFRPGRKVGWLLIAARSPPPPRNCVKFYILMLLWRHNCSKNGSRNTHTHAWFPHFQYHFPTATQWVLLATLEIYNREIINTIWYITHPSRGGGGAFGGQILQLPFLCGVIFAIFPCVSLCVLSDIGNYGAPPTPCGAGWENSLVVGVIVMIIVLFETTNLDKLVLHRFVCFAGCFWGGERVGKIEN